MGAGDSVVVATFTTAAGSFSGLSPTALSGGMALGLATSAIDLRIVATAPRSTIVDSGVLDVFDDVAVIGVDFEPGPAAAELWFEYGPTTAYGEESEHLTVNPGDGGVYYAGIEGLLPG